ncbi:gluconokinase [Megamonas funiformis]|uniref:gluconokinase n=1 Tax=Megamonas funiformis TaxID=437897 RepID=UPI001CD6842A|nr:gluconokinase [Megamonas funiformis]UBS47984.1 gluconokinase [Megamonas funiformis]GLU98941.1 gluconate kinase [Megamonas funiformis]
MLDFSNTRSCIWIGVDVGTTGVRAIAYQKDGLSLCSADEFYPLETPYPDWAEQNPEIIYKAIEKVVREVANTLIYKGKNVSGIAISTVMHSFAPANENHELLSNMITWADSRSVGIVNELKKDEALVKGFYERTCCPTHSCYPFLKILWVRKNYPDVFAKMRYIYSLKDYIFEKMTGEWVVDKSSASASGLYNAHKMDWDEEILNYAGITREQLPPVVSTTYQSKLTDSAAQRLNLPENLPVVIGATDGVLVNVGIGAIEDGQLSATIGTSGAIRMLTKTPKVDSLGRTWCYNLTDDMWVAGGAINNGGIIMRWLRDKVCHYSNHRLEDIDIDPYDLMTLKASKIPAGAEGLLLLPFFTGERAPYWNSELRGMFFGLSLNHSRSHMIRAGMEGICFSLNCVLSALKDFGQVKDIRVSGSFTKSPLWLQIMADIFGEHITLPQNSEGAAFGAAVLGFIASGEMKDISDTANLIKPKKVYKPQAENKEVYEELFDIYSSLYEKLQPDFARITTYQNKMYK